MVYARNTDTFIYYTVPLWYYKDVTEMTTTATYQCRCKDCGMEFDSSEIVELFGITMGGNGDSWQEFVSPCCHADYEEIDRT